MCKRIGILMVLLMFIFGTSLCWAEDWVKVGHDGESDVYYDKDNIKRIEIGLNSILKLKTKEVAPDESYSIAVTFINIDNKTYYWGTDEKYDKSGNLLSVYNFDYKKSQWLNGRNVDWVEEILKREGK